MFSPAGPILNWAQRASECAGMSALPLILLFVAAQPREPFTSPKSATAEFGHGLTADEAHAGWISLFDGTSTFGWKNAQVNDGVLSGGENTTLFAAGIFQGEAVAAGQIVAGDRTLDLPAGPFRAGVESDKPFSLRLGAGLRLRKLALLPLNLTPVFNGKDLTGWTVIKHPRLPAEKQAKWSVENGVIAAVGGPGALELNALYGDLVLQLKVRTRARLVNGGVFFRCVPGQFLNGYEAQVFNACYGEDPDRPARYSTGALDDRQLARRVVSRDMEPFTMTIVATGPHIATWVNGHQMVDWNDTRELNDNPRQGLRLKPGAIQLQAHDRESDLEFSAIRITEIR